MRRYKIKKIKGQPMPKILLFIILFMLLNPGIVSADENKSATPIEKKQQKSGQEIVVPNSNERVIIV